MHSFTSILHPRRHQLSSSPFPARRLVYCISFNTWRESSDTANGFYIGVRFRVNEYGSLVMRICITFRVSVINRGSQKVRIEPCEVFGVSFLLFVWCRLFTVRVCQQKLNSHQNMDNTSWITSKKNIFFKKLIFDPPNLQNIQYNNDTFCLLFCFVTVLLE